MHFRADGFAQAAHTTSDDSNVHNFLPECAEAFSVVT
jgi:hypothetical protein